MSSVQSVQPTCIVLVLQASNRSLMVYFLAGLAGIHILKDEVGVVLLNKCRKCN